MWLFLNDAFFSIVSKDCPRDSLLVRARRAGDIEKVFPGHSVKRDPAADYLFRAVVPRRQIVDALAGEVGRITYGNFKDSVDDDELHRAYLRVWAAMLVLQPAPAFRTAGPIFNDPHFVEADAPPKPRRKRGKNLKKGR